jgi:hypothetical protein
LFAQRVKEPLPAESGTTGARVETERLDRVSAKEAFSLFGYWKMIGAVDGLDIFPQVTFATTCAAPE